MNSLPNPNVFKGRQLNIPFPIERNLEDWTNLGGGIIEDDSGPFDSYIEVMFEVQGPAGKRFWRVIGSR